MARAVVTTGAGRRVHVDADDPGAASLLEARVAGPDVVSVLWRRLVLAETWELVVHAGVGYGESVVAADPPAGAEVVVLEPDLARHPYLRRTLADNGLRVGLRPDALVRPAGGAPTTRVVGLDEVVGPRERSFCVRVEVPGLLPAVVRGAAAVLRWEVPWVLLVRADGDSRDAVAALAGERDLLLLDPATQRLLPATPAGRDGVGRLLDRGAHPHHVVVASPSIADAVAEGLV